MSAAAPSLLPGQSAPLTIITATDKSGLVLIITSLGLAFALMSLLIRAYVRHEFSPQRFAWDDAVVGVATMFSIFQNAAVYVAVAKGFGKVLGHISPQHLVEIEKSLYASDLLYILTLWLTKYSAALLFLRLSPDRRHIMASKMVMVVATVTGVVSVLVVALRCNLSHPWQDINAQCTGLFARWQVVAAFDIATEICLFGISVYMVQGLQMSFYKKIVVIFAFGLRLPVIVPCAFRLHYISDTLTSSDPTLTGVFASICTQIEIMYAIIAATIPCLRPFMTATATNYGAPAPMIKTPGNTRYGAKSSENDSNNNSNNSGFNLASLSSHLRSTTSRLKVRSEKDNDLTTQSTTMNDSGHLNVNGGVYGGDSFGRHDATVTGARARGASSIESTESKQMIIRKDVDYMVEYDDRAGSRNSGRENGIGHAV